MSADRTGRLRPNPDSELALAGLPRLAPPRDLLPQVLAEVRRRQRRSQRPRPPWIAWAGAAVLVVSAGVISLLAQRMDRQSEDLAQWVAYSQQLEAQLRVLGGRGQVLRGHRAAAMGDLEDQIALIDWQLAERPGDAAQRALWRQRAVLLHDLVTVQAGERVLSDAWARRPVVTLNPPLAVPASYEL